MLSMVADQLHKATEANTACTVFGGVMVSLQAKSCIHMYHASVLLALMLQQHGGWVFKVAPEGCQPVGSNGTIHDAVIAAQSHCHDAGLPKASRWKQHYALLCTAHCQDAGLHMHEL